ncbi:Glycogen debranching enzyme [Nymphon striatum]|nr:Glycogen debranching enzyme [Nymphon striatum]
MWPLHNITIVSLRSLALFITKCSCFYLDLVKVVSVEPPDFSTVDNCLVVAPASKNPEDLKIWLLLVITNCFDEIIIQFICRGIRSGIDIVPDVRDSVSKMAKVFDRGDTSKSENISITKVLALNYGENLENKIFQFELGWSVRFTLGSSLFGRNICLFVNVPDTEKKFVRTQYRRLSWHHESENKDDSALYAEVKLSDPGSFHYYFRSDKSDERLGCGYFLVHPFLYVGLDPQPLSLDSIQCQTVLSKLLGPLSEWEERLLVTKESGYNMIHFTPIQALGGSNSAYSLLNQHRLNPRFNDDDKSYEMADVAQLMEKINRDWHILCVTDIVLNHTSDESPWVQEYPDSAYNLVNSPYLRPAYLLDKVLHLFSLEVANGKWETKGLSPCINQEHHLNIIRDVLQNYFLPKAKIYEMFTVDVDKTVKIFESYLKVDYQNHPINAENGKIELKIIQDEMFRRNASTIDFSVAIDLFTPVGFNKNDEKSIIRCCSAFRHHLNNLNNDVINEVNKHLMAAVENVIHSMRYERLQHDGPKIKLVTKEHPLVPRQVFLFLYSYFTHAVTSKDLEGEENIIWSDKSSLIMAHNGWVMNDDPLKNFADKDSNVYLRRELIAWTDCVKLRYGKKPQDSPFLWKYMKTYVEDTAKMFHGIRLDNCHSTPIEVAEYVLDAARQVRPNIYVFAELFTSNEATDNIFVNRLGINSLIREAMSAHDSHELGRLVHRYGGYPVGSFFQPNICPIAPSIAHALFYDATHDNPSPVQKHSVYDALPSTALVSMACCASGSNRGYDELIPYHIHVVKESRLYSSWNEKNSTVESSSVHMSSGIIHAKRALNDLHYHLGTSGFNEVYVDQVTADVVAVTRHRPSTHSSVILVAHTAFSDPSSHKKHYIPPLCVPGKVEEVILEVQLNEEHDSATTNDSKKFLVGLSNFKLRMKEHIKLNESEMVMTKSSSDSLTTEIEFVNFPPGSVIAIK